LQHHAHVGDGVLVDFAAEAVAVQLHLEDVLGGQEGVDVLAVSAISPLRMRSSRVSSTWVTSVMSVTPNVDAPPLTEWAVRKIAFRSSASGVDVDGQQQPFHFSQQFFGLIEKTW
jgi:hypothetical protein